MGESSVPQTDATKTRKKRGVFPRLPLLKILDLPSKVHELGDGNPISRLLVFDQLGQKANSDPSREKVIASGSGYGLTTGAYNSTELVLTDRGLRAVSGDPRTRYEALVEALFSSEPFAAITARYAGKNLPVDAVAIDFLKSSQQLEDADAQACWNVIKQNLTDFGFIVELSGKPAVQTREKVLEGYIANSPVTLPDLKSANPLSADGGHANTTGNVSPTRNAQRERRRLEPQFHFNIQVVIPENADSDTYESIFKCIAKYLLDQSEE